MTKLTRRDFLQNTTATLAGALGTTLLEAAPSDAAAAREGATKKPPAPIGAQVDKVKLGSTGITTSRIAFGTGTVGNGKSSNQTRLGMDKFVALAHHAYARGIRFFDMADGYGSHRFVGQAIKGIPRDEITLLSKIWTQEDSAKKPVPIDKIVTRFLGEIGVERLDILLMHCLMRRGWAKVRQRAIEGFQKAKADRVVKAIGVSCHNWDALVEAVDTPWVDVIMARINPFGTMMDNKPEVVKPLLRKAVAGGKCVIGMKIFGEGSRIKETEREQSIRYAISEVGVSCVTLGMESPAQIDDAVSRVLRFAGSKVKEG
ncbi:MAG: aldo/keto reductase [Puniceicoccales bacterium]|jgi:predicted aldo/keto reductase-like oxidoreductase|nr:aldo/keto reductase [Puniceicoccales bacterium]